jgi:transcriptional regulator of acetoin/glycerol metabolism
MRSAFPAQPARQALSTPPSTSGGEGDHSALIVASHDRCAAYGIRAEYTPDYARVGKGEFRSALDRSRGLLNRAVPVVENLAHQIANTGNVVVLTDAQGLILHTCGDADFLPRADQVALQRGALWSEQAKGTNAIGTALALGRSTFVHAAEHFLHAHRFLTCACSPILDPFGRAIGAIDISGDQASFHHHTLALARMSAQTIENQLFQDVLPGAYALRFHSRPELLGTLMEGIAAFDPAGALLAANPSARFQLGLAQQPPARQVLQELFDMTVQTLVLEARRHGGGPRTAFLRSGVRVHFVAERLPGLPTAPRESRCGMESGGPSPASMTVPSGQTQGIDQAAVLPGGRATRPGSRGPDAQAPAGAPSPSRLHYLDTGDAAMRRVLDKVGRVLGKDIPLLILGETGCGKEMLARAIHGDSPRGSGPFIPINCAAIPEGLIESELFGYAPGAFTGGRRHGNSGRILAANGGTLFLDEIGDMPLALQSRLLRVLEARELTPLGSDKAVALDFSLVCATHRDLAQCVESNAFREDLYYRINGLSVRIPALRERSDLGVIVHRLLLRERAADVRVGPEVQAFFERYRWPGNVRQLANVLRTAVQMLDEDQAMRLEHLPDDLLGAVAGGTGNGSVNLDRVGARMEPPAGAGASTADAASDISLQQIELRAMVNALEVHAGNVSAACRSLGISRNTFYRRMALLRGQAA